MRCGLMCIDGTIFFTASYRCSGSGGLVHGCVRARADINTTITASARACINMPCFALAMLMREGDKATGGTRRDLIIGCAVLAA
jgi:hypothetical protein